MNVPLERLLLKWSLWTLDCKKKKNRARSITKLFVTYAFTELNLHRIQAEVQPYNVGSIRVLEKAGFHQEGLATKNLKIRGEWKDHQVLAIINPAD